MCSQQMLKEKPVSRPLVLIVDDEQSICSSLAAVLSDESYETIAAHDGVQAVDMVKCFQPALVFLDIWMPGSDGLETLQRIKQVSPGTEVVMISGHATISTALEAMKLGAMDFIEKPFDIESVVVCASRALERRSRRQRRNSAGAAKNTPKRSVGGGAEAASLHHPGMSFPGWRGRDLGQRTLRESVILYGQCLHSGMKSGLVLEPLPRDSGLHFSQMGVSHIAPVFVDNVFSTNLATSVRSGSSEIATIEHLMSALHAYRISNLLIKCNGEVPIFDGSAEQFCDVIESVGIEEQGGEWFEIAVPETVSLGDYDDDSKESIVIEPASELSISYELNYPPPIGRQDYEVCLDSVERFRREIAPARTFGFLRDVERLYKAGLGAGARLDNFVLIGPDRVLNTALRFDEEMARHKILDIMGDLFLIGRPLRGAIKARMTGHSDNIALLKELKQRIWQSASIATD